MTRVVERKQGHAPQESRQPPWRRADGEQDHDLPVIAIDTNPRVQVQWESLMGQGIVPALVLGAERRCRGPR